MRAAVPALSMRAVTGKPIKFLGAGEKTDALEIYHPDRLAGRILGMGDVVSLVEKAAATIDMDDAEDMAEKLMSGGRFDFNDLAKQMQQMRKMGGMGGLMNLDARHGQDQRADQERQYRRQSYQASGSDHPVDDARPNARMPICCKPRASAASRRGRASMLPTSTASSSNFLKCKR